MATVDITPSPRVLRMLGQIDFAPWQCLAELIDNSIDAFIDQQRDGALGARPVINVYLPSEPELRSGEGVIEVVDNGRGMTLEQMESAVKAGYSGNDPLEKMGLFGMGFNISTARLGRKTEVWTTTSDSPNWTGIVIDFDTLEREKTFHAPVLSRPKSENELNEPTHGTVIKIESLEADRIGPLTRGMGKSKTKIRLGRIYGRVMQELGISILYDGARIQAWKHCTWGANRSVKTKDFGNVSAILPIEGEFSSRKYCNTCWVWLSDHEDVCSACGSDQDLTERNRTVRGWIGVQRYFDKNDYGIDLIRNGRVIETSNKSFFTFIDSDGEDLFEYPRDATHWGGRIVGELEIDFVRVSHQKDAFDKLDPEWKHVVSVVRGNSPLQPQIAKRMSLPPNDSPLARLYSAYRKGDAGLKSLVPGNEQGGGLNSGLVIEYKEKFYAGEYEFQSDEKLFDLVQRAERAKRGGSAGADEARGKFPIVGEKTKTPESQQSGSGKNLSKELSEVKDTRLSRVYEYPELPGNPKITVEAFSVSGPIEGKPFVVEPSGPVLRFRYSPRHNFFEDSLETPTDCLIVEMAHHFLALASETIKNWPLSVVSRQLRDRYFPDSVSDVNGIADQAESCLLDLKAYLEDSLPQVAQVPLDSLTETCVAQIRSNALRDEGADTEKATSLIQDGMFGRFLDSKYLVEVVENWPALVMDGKFYSQPFENIEEPLRARSLKGVLDCLDDLVWLSEDSCGTVNKDTAWRLRYARAIASLNLLNSWLA
ncbi:MAG: ATP-binding protein [Halieaceae bacterium]